MARAGRWKWPDGSISDYLPDPANADKVQLEVLVKALKEKRPNVHIVLTLEGWLVHEDWTKDDDGRSLAVDPDFRTAVIAAIC